MPATVNYNPLRLAVKFATKFGWPVFPVRGKRPVIAGRDWRDYASVDPTEIAQQDGWALADGYGVVIPPSGFVVDLDTDEDGLLNRAIAVISGAMPGVIEESARTLRVCTPSGGVHWYFRCSDPGVRIHTGRPFGATVPVDLKGPGSYVVGPGSQRGAYVTLKPYVPEIATTHFPWAAGALSVH